MTTNSNDFSIVIAQELYNSDNPFPVDFDTAWKWLDYNKKSDAKKALLNCGFTADIDFLINPQSDNHAGLSPQEKAVLARKESIFLTVECFKSWAMLSSTDKDKQTIHAYVTGGLGTVAPMTLKSAEIHTTTGLKTVALLSEEQIVEVVTKYKPELLAKFANNCVES